MPNRLSFQRINNCFITYKHVFHLKNTFSSLGTSAMTIDNCCYLLLWQEVCMHQQQFALLWDLFGFGVLPLILKQSFQL